MKTGSPHPRIHAVTDPRHPLHSQGGWLSMESMYTYAFYMIMIAVVALAAVVLFGNSKLSDAEQLISSMRMETIRIFSGSNTFSGLDSDFALKSGIIPRSRIRGNVARNPWGGALEISPSDGDASMFSITLDQVPEKDCTSLSMFQNGAWEEVSINGTTIDQEQGVGTAAAACSGANNIMVFTAR